MQSFGYQPRSLTKLHFFHSTAQMTLITVKCQRAGAAGIAAHPFSGHENVFQSLIIRSDSGLILPFLIYYHNLCSFLEWLG